MNEVNYSRGTDTIEYINTCIHCSEQNKIKLDKEPFEKWKYQGQYVQHAFPHLSIDDRELLVSGTHPKCWNEIFPD